MYMEGFKCKVTNAKSTTPVGIPKPPAWCEDDQSKCVQGPKQIMIWNQLEATNIEVEGMDLNGDPKSPAYNAKCGFHDGKFARCFVSLLCLLAVVLQVLKTIFLPPVARGWYTSAEETGLLSDFEYLSTIRWSFYCTIIFDYFFFHS